MEDKTFPGSFTEADLEEQVNRHFAELDEDQIRSTMASIARDEGCEFIIYKDNDPFFQFNIDPSKLSRNNPRKIITAYTFMDVDQLRRFLQDLCFKSCVDRNTRQAKIRCDLRLQGQTVVSRVKVWEQGDSDFDDLGDEDEDETLYEEVLHSEQENFVSGCPQEAWIVFERMKAPQLRRVIHIICGGVYKLDLLPDEDYFNCKESLASLPVIATLFIDSTEVALTHEAETCDLLEKMAAYELKDVLRSLCSASLVSETFYGKQLTIDGSTVTLRLDKLAKSQGGSQNESGEQDSVEKNYRKRKNRNRETLMESIEKDPIRGILKKEKKFDNRKDVEAPDEELSEPELYSSRKRPKLWVETNQLLGYPQLR